jgi:thiol-disulfide isomerase/thioredoxin
MHFRSRRSTALALAALGALLVAPAAVQAGSPGKPMIVKIHADWCGTCARLNSTFEELEARVGSDAEIVVLDVTDRTALEQSRARAQELGIVAFFEQYKGRTGTVGVLDASGKVVVVLSGETDPDKYVEALKKARKA